MSELPYFSYDVFTDAPFGGGPLAVVDCRGLSATAPSTQLMQKIAAEFSLPETTFIFEPDDSRHLAKVRIFTMAEELPMAGHPTIGTSLHLFSTIQSCPTQFILELGVGPTAIDIEETDQARAYMYQQPMQNWHARAVDRIALAASLGIATEAIAEDSPLEFFSAGLTFLIVPITSRELLNSITPSQIDIGHVLKNSPSDRVYVFSLDDSDAQIIHTRMFNSDIRDMTEDPGTGSAAGALAHYFSQHSPQLLADTKSVTLHQGYAMGRPSEITISLVPNSDGVQVPRVGGSAWSIARGVLLL